MRTGVAPGTPELAEPFAEWSRHWQASKAGFAEFGESIFSEGAVVETCQKIGIEGSAYEAVLAATRQIHDSPRLRRIAWHCYFMIFLSGMDQLTAVKTWPTVSRNLAIGWRLIYAVVCLAGFRELRKSHERLGLPADVTRDTMTDVRIWLLENHRQTGRWVFEKIDWLVRHCQSKLFRLGRGQVELTPLQEPLRVLRNRHEGWVVAHLCEVQRAGHQQKRVFEDRVRVIDPHGRFLPGRYEFPQNHWATVLEPGETIGLLHLPAEGALGWRAAYDSLQRINAFLRETSSHFEAKAIYAEGWLMDPLLPRVLPPHSLSSQIQRRFYLAPFGRCRDELFWGRVSGDPAMGWQRTRLARRLKAAAQRTTASGERPRGGVAFRLVDETSWDRAVYRSLFDQWRRAQSISPYHHGTKH